MFTITGELWKYFRFLS